jgi:hypothetical protein
MFDHFDTRHGKSAAEVVADISFLDLYVPFSILRGSSKRKCGIIVAVDRPA